VYVNGEAHANSIEGFWTLFKRGHYGAYHYMSKKHLQHYVDEFVYRFNARHLKLFDAFACFVKNVGKTSKLPYKVLTNNGQETQNT